MDLKCKSFEPISIISEKGKPSNLPSTAQTKLFNFENFGSSNFWTQIAAVQRKFRAQSLIQHTKLLNQDWDFESCQDFAYAQLCIINFCKGLLIITYIFYRKWFCNTRYSDVRTTCAFLLHIKQFRYLCCNKNIKWTRILGFPFSIAHLCLRELTI